MILITGGLGYIGSHVSLALISRGIDHIIVDSLSNNPEKGLSNFRQLSDYAILNKVKLGFVRCDVQSEKFLEVVSQYNVDTIIHLAAKKAVLESQAKPQEYIDTNVGSTKVIAQLGVNVVFASSASVYGNGVCVETIPLGELKPTSVYGETKVASEVLLQSLENVTSLRFFNVIGNAPGFADQSTSNLGPAVIKAWRDNTTFNVFGTDFNTPDGTAIRDYVSVEDIAEEIIKAIHYKGKNTFNVGAGLGLSVKEMLQLFGLSGVLPKVEVKPRRPGDPDALVAFLGKLGPVARRSIYNCCLQSKD